MGERNSNSPKRHRQETHKQEQAAQHTEDQQRPILRQPIHHEIRQPERQQVACVDRHERLLVQLRVTINHIPEHTRRRERQTHIREPERQHRPSPVRLIVHRGPESEETHRPEDDRHGNEREAELRLVDALVLPRQIQTDPIVQRARDNLPDDRQDERAETNQPRLADGEVIRRRRENLAVHHREHHDPRQRRAVDEEPPEDGGVPEEDEWAGEDLPDGGIRVSSGEDAEGAHVGVLGFGGRVRGAVGEVGVLLAGETRGVVLVSERHVDVLGGGFFGGGQVPRFGVQRFGFHGDDHDAVCRVERLADALNVVGEELMRDEDHFCQEDIS
jgi:hypothetical protein